MEIKPGQRKGRSESNHAKKTSIGGMVRSATWMRQTRKHRHGMQAVLLEIKEWGTRGRVTKEKRNRKKRPGRDQGRPRKEAAVLVSRGVYPVGGLQSFGYTLAGCVRSLKEANGMVTRLHESVRGNTGGGKLRHGTQVQGAREGSRSTGANNKPLGP